MIGLGLASEGEVLPSGCRQCQEQESDDRVSAKEGLALNNGTQAMPAYLGTLPLYDALNLEGLQNITAALLQGSEWCRRRLDHRVHDVRPHSAHGSRKPVESFWKAANTTRQGEIRVQDAYSLRCCPPDSRRNRMP